MKQQARAPISGPTSGRAARLGHVRRALGTRASSLRATGSDAPSSTLRFGLLFALSLLALALGATAASAAPPTSTLNPITTHSITTAHLSGMVDPADHETYYCFEYSTDPGTVGWSGFCYQGPLATESGSTEVSRDLTNLSAATEYKVRLTARNFIDPEVFSSEGSFTTNPAPNVPALALEPATPSYVSAHIQGTLDPEGGNEDTAAGPVPIAWQLQYTTNPLTEGWQYGNAGVIEGAEAQSDPGPGEGIEVAADLTGLHSGSTYEFRLIATYAGKEARSPEPSPTFTTKAVAKPTLAINDASLLTPTTAKASGTVELENEDPAFDSSCVFQYISDAAFQANLAAGPPLPGFEGASQIACEPETVLGTEAQPVSVIANLTGLTPTATYHLRLLAANSGGSAEAVAAHTFTTPAAPPTVVQTGAGAISETGATLNAQIDPGGAPTTYHFEYGPTTAYGTSVPIPDEAVGSDNAAHSVSAQIAGLAPATTYHFRAVATNTSPGNPFTLGPDRTFRTFAPAPAGETCPNEQLRSENNSTQLAACRAYEMLTPPFKDGGTEIFPQVISADGSRVESDTLSGFAGVESNFLGADYVSVRSESGWATESIMPPASRFPAHDSKGMSADLTESLWALREPSQSVAAEDLYLREADRSFVEVGPAIPPAVAAGPPAGSFGQFSFPAQRVSASADLSHVFFALQGAYWPGDTTNGEGNGHSLYEYVGTGNTEPILVGVSDGATVLNGNTLPAGHLISECETVLGGVSRKASGGIDVYNAISHGGETVFFTAAGPNNSSLSCTSPISPAFNQVYARIGQGPGAHTAAISQPTPADCEACLQGETAEGFFQGASEDGSEAFFLTEQELLSGAKGKNLYEYDFDNPAGHRIVPVSTLTGVEEPGVLGVARVSEDGSHVYFVASGRLTEEPRGGLGGPCWSELDQGELAEEETGAEEGRCRPKQGQANLYVFERDATHPAGTVSFLATLSSADSKDWQGQDNRPVQATPDGRFLAFQSAADPLVGESGSASQVFEYDALSEELVRASVAEPGYAVGQLSAEARGAGIPAQEFGGRQLPANASTGLALSENGRVVAFSSTAGLTPSAQTAAENGSPSVYEYRSGVAGIGAGRVSLVTNGSSPFQGTRLLGIDSSAQDLFFKSAEPYLPSDTDSQFDFYDARSAGGFPASLATPSCAGEGCQGTLLAAPAKAAPATPGFHGPANETPKPKKHHKRHHAKKHHKRSHKRAANTNRRAGR